MPGIFAPTLEESSTAIQPLNPIENNVAGDAFNNLANIVGSLADSGTGSDNGPTQKERDNAALQPLAQRLNEIEKMAATGELHPLRKRHLIEEETNKFLEANPILTDEVRELTSTVSGVDVDRPDDSPHAILERGQFEWLQSPAGLNAIRRSITFNDKGEYDVEETERRLQESFFQHMANEVNVTRMQQRVQMAEGRRDLQQIAIDEVGTEKLQQHIRESGETAAAMLDQFGANFTATDPTDSAALLQDLDEQIEILRTKFQIEMSAFPGASTYDVEQALAPLINMRTVLEKNVERLPELAKAVQAQDRITLRRFMKKMGAPIGPTTDDAHSYVFQTFWFGNLDKIGVKANMPDSFDFIEEEIWNPGVTQPMDSEGNPRGNTDIGNVLDISHVERRFADVPDKDKENIIKASAAYFETTPMDILSSDSMRNEAVKYFAQAVAAANSMKDRGPLTNQTLKKIYSPEFMRRFEKISSFNDMTSKRLGSLVEIHLGTVFNQKLSILDKDLKSQGMPEGVKLIFRNGKFELDGIPESSQPLASVRPGMATREEVEAARKYPGVSSSVIQQLNNLNEVYRIIQSIPDEDTRKNLEGMVTDEFSMRSGDRVRMVEARTREDWDSAPSGSFVIVYNEDGEVADVVRKP